MQLPDDPEIRAVLANAQAREFRAYIERRNRRHPDDLVTVGRLCQRFRLRQSDVVACVEQGGAGLTISEFAYAPTPEGANWGEMLAARFHPQIAPDAPLSRRLVSIVGEAP